MDNLPNYLNLSNIDPAHVEPMRSGKCPNTYFVGPVKHCVSVCATPYITTASETYEALFRRMKDGAVVNDIYDPGNSLKAEYITMITLQEGSGAYLHVIEAYGTMESMEEVEENE